MNEVLVLGIIFGGALMALAIIGGTLLMAIKLLKGGISRHDRKRQADEVIMVQELYHGLEKMENRIEALETILLEGTGKDRS